MQPAHRRIGYGPEPLEDVFPVRGIEQAQVDLPVVPPGEPCKQRPVLDVLAGLAGLERLFLVHERSQSESELGVPERGVHAVHRAVPAATRAP
jgi:hypothetical protein